MSKHKKGQPFIIIDFALQSILVGLYLVFFITSLWDSSKFRFLAVGLVLMPLFSLQVLSTLIHLILKKFKDKSRLTFLILVIIFIFLSNMDFEGLYMFGGYAVLSMYYLYISYLSIDR